MKKKMIIVCFIVIGLAMGSALVTQNAAVAAYDAFQCWVPYNIKTGAWNTGIHITANHYASEKFKVKFFNGTGNYKTVYLDLNDYHGGFTGAIQDLFNLSQTDPLGVDLPMDKEDSEITAAPPGPAFTSPSFFIIYSNMSYFMVSQFILNSVNGYGFQTFFSWPYGSWLNPSIVLSEPLDKSQGAGDNFEECASGLED